MFCSNCGKEIDDKAVICPGCGCKLKKSGSVSILCIWASLCVPFAGLILGIINLCKKNTKAGIIYLMLFMVGVISIITAVYGGYQGAQ